jgi:uncharacterized protein (TIGR02246 family)
MINPSVLVGAWLPGRRAIREYFAILCRPSIPSFVVMSWYQNSGAREIMEKTRHKPASKDETEILALIERWALAVRNEDRAAIREDHDSEMLMFDVPPPFLSRGLDAYMATWALFFSSVEKPVKFDFHDIEITAGEDVAFATAVGSCVNIDSKDNREPLEFRLTMGLRKIDGRWRIMHEHHSLPAVE